MCIYLRLDQLKAFTCICRHALILFKTFTLFSHLCEQPICSEHLHVLGSSNLNLLSFSHLESRIWSQLVFKAYFKKKLLLLFFSFPLPSVCLDFYWLVSIDSFFLLFASFWTSFFSLLCVLVTPENPEKIIFTGDIVQNMLKKCAKVRDIAVCPHQWIELWDLKWLRTLLIMDK